MAMESRKTDARSIDEARSLVPAASLFHGLSDPARLALLQHLAPEGELTLDWDDEITAGACVTREQVAA